MARQSETETLLDAILSAAMRCVFDYLDMAVAQIHNENFLGPLRSSWNVDSAIAGHRSAKSIEEEPDAPCSGYILVCVPQCSGH